MKRARRRVAVVTGSRAEYGLLRSSMQAIADHPELSLQLVVTGMHLLRKFGHTIDDVIADGWRVDARIRMQTGRDDPLDQAAGLSRGIAGMARFFESARTEIVVVLGDRIEAMAGALAAVTTGRILAHVHGGDVAPGDLDEGLRHAITKLAHVHFAATRAAADRIIRMGESPRHVHHVGAPGLDELRRVLADSPAGSLRKRPVALVLYHACGRSPATERRAMRNVLHAVRDAGLSPLVIYPNSDRGHQGVIEAIHAEKARSNGSLTAVRSLSREHYLRVLASAALIVGNSSSGIIEAGSAGTPAVNVGDRQKGRQRSGSSVIDCDETCGAIRRAVQRALKSRPRRGAPTCYGDGNAGPRIAELLAGLEPAESLRRKQITY